MEQKTVVFDVRQVGANIIIDLLTKYFHREPRSFNFPDSVIGWEPASRERTHEFIFIVPEDQINYTREQCAEIELRSFTIISNKGMIIGG